eukprot:g75150.t1
MFPTRGSAQQRVAHVSYAWVSFGSLCVGETLSENLSFPTPISVNPDIISFFHIDLPACLVGLVPELWSVIISVLTITDNNMKNLRSLLGDMIIVVVQSVMVYSFPKEGSSCEMPGCKGILHGSVAGSNPRRFTRNVVFSRSVSGCPCGNKARQDKTRQGKTRQDRDRDKTRQYKTIQDKSKKRPSSSGPASGSSLHTQQSISEPQRVTGAAHASGPDFAHTPSWVLQPCSGFTRGFHTLPGACVR